MFKRTQREILDDVKRLAIEYYAVTGKPLGVSGELAEFEAAEKLGLILADARTAGYDAIRSIDERSEKIRIKGRRIASGKPRYRGRVPAINVSVWGTSPYATGVSGLPPRLTHRRMPRRTDG